MEMLQLRYFFESALDESFTKTAKKYMVPVSSVSSSIRRLENELGVALFERTGNRIFLTEKGKQFLKSVDISLKELQKGVGAVTADHADIAPLTVLVRSARRAIAYHALKFQEIYPSVAFKIDIAGPDSQSSGYDIVVGPRDDTLVDYDTFELFRQRIRVEAKAGDVLCGRKITLNHLRDRVFVTPNSEGGVFKKFAAACERNGFTPRVIMECNDYVCYNMYISSGAALGVTMGNKQKPRMSDADFLDIADFDELRIINAYYKKEAYQGKVKLFVDFLRDRYDSI